MIRGMLVGLNRLLVPLLALWGLSSQSVAQPIELPAGLACPDFGISVEIFPPAHRVDKTFYDKNGNPIRYLHAGKGNRLVFTNLGTGSTLSMKTGGSVEHITPNPDGTETWVTTGHEVMILFPTDTPPGPATTLYIGRLVFTLDPSSFTLLGIQSFTGKSVDICAALAA